jgi:hypothetical protein
LVPFYSAIDTQTEKEEQEIAEACNRLIKNSIICWNYLYLARQIEKVPDTESKENLMHLIAAHSPMSWAHINMLGEYDFSEEKLRDTLGILPPEKGSIKSVQNGGCKNKKNPVNPMSYRKRYVGFRTFMLRNPTLVYFLVSPFGGLPN